MSELTVTLLRFGFLALLWIFVLAVVTAQGRDLRIGGKLRTAGAETRSRRDASREGDGERKAPSTGPSTGGTRQRPQQLVVLEGPLAGSSFQLGAAPVLLGRSPEATVPLEDDYASGRHARLFPQGSRWFLEDLGSTNGTFVNDHRLSRALAVDPGTQFRIGRTVMELRT